MDLAVGLTAIIGAYKLIKLIIMRTTLIYKLASAVDLYSSMLIKGKETYIKEREENANRK